MKPAVDPSLQTADFNCPYQAIKDTEWMAEPANPINPDRGLIRQGETIWLHPQLLLNTADWQLACLGDKTLRYVRHTDFEPIKAGDQ